MIDPTIIAAVQLPAPPERPLIVEERTWDPGAADFERFAMRRADAFEHYAHEWFQRVERARTQLSLVVIPYPATPELLEFLTGAIADHETEAEIRAIRTARLQKRIAREVKRLFPLKPSVAAAMRTAGERMVATEKRIVETLLDMALVLRAMRADGDPEARGGETFDDPEALARDLGVRAARA